MLDKTVLFWMLLSCVLGTSQTVEQFTNYGLKVQTRGALNHNRNEGINEFYEQYSSLFVGLDLTTSIQVQTGITKSRVGNQEILEFPFLFKYQLLEKLTAYGGAQVQISRGVGEESFSTSFREFSGTIGLDYQFSKTTDAGIQIIIPAIENENIPAGNFKLSHPIRLRTGIKF